MKLIIGGDFCPENRAEDRLIAEDEIFDKGYRELWDAVDFRILNLEGPITHSTQRIKKVGRHIRFNPEILQGIKKMGVDCFSLANNHIMDFGAEGFKDTIKYLEGIDIGYFGCSTNKYNILEKEGIKVAMLSFSNNEFSDQSDYDGTGAYGIDIINLMKTIFEANQVTKNIVVILHTGLSKFPFPSPKQRELCHFLIDNGVSAVLCQHSHTIGSYEHYGNGFISYGQGSFVFDLIRNNSIWNEGYSLSLTFQNRQMKVDIIPHKQFDNTLNVRLLTNKEMSLFHDKMDEYNKVISSTSLLEERWLTYLDNNEKYYINQFFLPKNRILRKLLNRFNFLNFISEGLQLTLLNNLRNDEHKEVMVDLLKRNIYK